MTDTREIYKEIEHNLTRVEVISLMYALQENYNIKTYAHPDEKYSKSQLVFNARFE